MIKTQLFALAVASFFSLAGCGGAPEESAALAETEDTLCREVCCGDACCLKGGKWEMQGSMQMCCRGDGSGGKICISDPTAWVRATAVDPEVPIYTVPVERAP